MSLDSRKRELLEHTLVQRQDKRQGSSNPYRYRAGRFVGRFENRKPTCGLTGGPATYFLDFTPTSPEEVAAICGCSVADLPDVLQHWTRFRKYQGNHILERIDPLAWVLGDPWHKLDLSFHLALSKRGLAAVRKSPGLPDLPGVSARTTEAEESAQAA